MTSPLLQVEGRLTDLILALLRRSFASGLETEVDAALAITANVFHSLGNDAHATKIDDILLQLSSLVIPLLPRLESGVSPLGLAERMDQAAQLLQRLVVLASPNEGTSRPNLAF